MSKTGSHVGGHTVWTKDDLLTEKDRAKAARKGNKATREAKQRAAERANDRLAAAAGRALIKAEAEAAKAKGSRLKLRRITGPNGRKVRCACGSDYNRTRPARRRGPAPASSSSRRTLTTFTNR